MSKVYIVIETDSSDSKWCYAEAFTKKENAVMRLHDLYEENVLDENEDLMEKAEFKEDEASATTKNGDTVSWFIKECEVR